MSGSPRSGSPNLSKLELFGLSGRSDLVHRNRLLYAMTYITLYLMGSIQIEMMDYKFMSKGSRANPY